MPNYVDAALNLVFPMKCTFCGKYLGIEKDIYICDSCLEDLPSIKTSICPKCGRPGTPYLCEYCVKDDFYFDKARSYGLYEGKLKEILNSFKFGCNEYLGKTLSFLLDSVVDKLDIDINRADLIVPVPLSFISRWKRGFNQSMVMAEYVGRRHNIDVSVGNLRRKRFGKPQVGLGRKMRLDNIKGEFYLRSPEEFKDKCVLLIDDVFTTGATVSECARAIKGAGVVSVEVLTLARGV